MSDDARQSTDTPSEAGGEQQSKSYDKIVEEVTERVLKLLREDLRLEQERRGKSGRR